MNAVLPARYGERIERLILGIEPIDAQRQTRIARPITVVLDGIPYPAGDLAFDVPGIPDPIGTLPPIPRRASCRHALVHPPDIPSPITIRLYDRGRRFVPRRLRYPVPADPTVPAPPVRVRRPALYPGAAYDVSPTATGLRGRVTWQQSDANEVPARWVRVEATINGQVVGRAHGDDRGEFLLLLRSEAGGVGALPAALVAQVTVFGPAAPVAVPPGDPFGDLPVETLVADPDTISAGEALPPGYAATALSSRPVSFEPGTLLTRQAKFFFTV